MVESGSENPLRIFGESENQVDDKGRISIPKRFQPFFEGGAFLAQSLDKICLTVWSKESWEKIQRRLDALPVYSEEADTIERFLGRGSEVALDTQGRMTISPTLRKSEGLTEQVTLVARGSKLEIWSPEGWSRYNASVSRESVRQALNKIDERLPAGA